MSAPLDKVGMRLDSGQALEVYREVHRERRRAHRKHDSNGGSMERKDYRDPTWLPVLVEEVGEVARELCERALTTDVARQFTDAERDETLRLRLRSELVQVAAMVTAWVAACDDDAPVRP